MKNYCRKVFYSTLDIGKGFDRKIFLLNDKQEKISFWNDVPLKDPKAPQDIFNAVIEIPRYTISKLELARDEPLHPLMHDKRQNIFNPQITELRSYAQYGFFNYGFLPQTWENVLLPNKEVLNLLVAIFDFFH
jgi:inorganic pyrophosphatase